jgi:lipopolysaccharide biosynthesis protein
VLKLHTKKSMHRGDGDVWRSYLYEQLMPQTEEFRAFWKSWEQSGRLGVVAPNGHLVRIRYFWGQNQYWLERIQQRLELSSAIDGEELFCAGSMFWFRPEAMMTLLRLRLQAGDFPPENGYVDATLAHALERVIVSLAVRDGFDVMTMSDLMGQPSQFDSDHWHGLLGA